MNQLSLPGNAAPVPTAFVVASATTPDGTKWILVQFTTPVGVQTYWFSADGVRALIEALRRSVGGLVVPASPEVEQFANRAERRRRSGGANDQ